MVTNPNLILIHGKIGHGKDTVAKIIQYLVGINRGRIINSSFKPEQAYDNLSGIQIKRFAGKLKQVVSLMTGISLEDLEKQEVKDSLLGPEWSTFISLEEVVKTGTGRRPLTVRELLQRLGTDAVRGKVHQDAWVNALFADYKPERVISGGMEHYMDEPEFQNPKWIIPDLRFPNEHSRGREKGGLLIKVVGEFPGVKHKAEKEHESETALDSCQDWDAILTNRGSLTDLVTDVKGILQIYNLIK